MNLEDFWLSSLIVLRCVEHSKFAIHTFIYIQCRFLCPPPRDYLQKYNDIVGKSDA